MKESNEKNHGFKRAVIILTVVSFAVLLSVALWLVTNKKETTTITEKKESEFSSLECKTADFADGFEPLLKPDTAEESEYVIKALFENKSLSDISYEFRGVYSSDQAAESAEAWFRTHYYQYMNSIEVNSESLNPVFVNSGKELRIGLYAERKRFTSATAPVFFMEREEYGTLTSMSPESLEKLYERKGFSCNIAR